MLENIRKDRQDAFERLKAAKDEQSQAWERLKTIKDKKIPLSDKGKAILTTAVAAPAIIEGATSMGAMHLPGNMGLGLGVGAILLSILQGDKAFRVGRWLKGKIVEDKEFSLQPEERTPNESVAENGGKAPSNDLGDSALSRMSNARASAVTPSLHGNINSDDSLNLSQDLSVHANDFLAERKLVVGTSGSGKSNTVADICEDLGGMDVPLVLFDTENEYESLCDDKYLPHWMRLDSSNLNTDNAAQWAAYILDNNVQAIVSLQDFPDEDAAWIMINMIEGFTKWQEEKPNDQRIPCEIILEEATTWLPQRTSESVLSTETLNALQSAFFNDVVRKGRKRGLGFTAVCQKIAEIDKRALQCRVKILHGQSELNDLKRYAEMGISSEETLSLESGEAFVWVGRIAKKRIQMRLRRSPHGAKTPDLAALRNRQSRHVGTTILSETLEELPMKQEAIDTNLQRKGIPAKYRRALEVWEKGIQTVRPFADAMGMKETAAYNLLREMDSRGFIQMKKRGR